MKSTNAIIFGLAIVLAAFWLGNSYVKRVQPQGSLVVKGMAQKDFTSDLIVWTGTFTETSVELKDAYTKIEKDRKAVKDYLISKGIKESEIVFDAVTSGVLTASKYTEEGKYIGSENTGYSMSQYVTINSQNVELVEKVSREITELLNEGINFQSNSPNYYYTKLPELKQQLIEEASKDAYNRAEYIVKNSNGKLGKLINADLGVFQITGQFEEEDYSWGGVFNTTSKNKTASVTVKLTYVLR